MKSFTQKFTQMEVQVKFLFYFWSFTKLYFGVLLHSRSREGPNVTLRNVSTQLVWCNPSLQGPRGSRLI